MITKGNRGKGPKGPFHSQNLKVEKTIKEFLNLTKIP